MTKLLLIIFLLAAIAVPAAAQTDIDVLYIQKTPLLNYDSANGGWPTVGSTVTWNAKVKNWGTSTIPSFVCEWWMDGVKMQTDTITNLAPGETRNITYPWIWQQDSHNLEFRADVTDVVPEVSEQNNVYTIRTNALTIGSWVEQSLYDWFHAHQIELGDGANSFEDWCYRMVRKWNEMNSLAVWPVTPNGIVDRVRIEKIVIVPDGALPLHGGLATNNPDYLDKTVDLMWGHPYIAADVQPGGFWQVSTTGPFFIDYGEIHELNHARYIVDHYGFDTHQGDASNRTILITDKYGNLAFPTAGMVYGNRCADIMGAGGQHYSEYAAGAWNRKAGIRGPRGNQNSPADIGVYLQDLPQNNYFRFVDNTGAPLVGATISVYQATGGTGWYAKYFDNVADLVKITDSNGTVNLGRCPFSATGTVTNSYGLSNATFIIKVTYSGNEYFTFGEVSDFGIQYWKGNTQNAYYTIQVPWGAANTSTPVGPDQWREEVHANKLGTLVDVKALDPNNLGGFALRIVDPPSSAVGKDYFSLRFTRDVFFNKGVYKFIMHTDDGGRLYVDDVNHIDHWVDGGAVPLAASASFDAPSLHTVKMDYYESAGAAVAALAIVPPLDTVPGPEDWKMEIYNSTNFTNLVEVSACPAKEDGGFDLNWGDRGPGPVCRGDGFSVRFTRTVNWSGGTCRFATVSDDGVRLYVDGLLKIDNWTAHPPTSDSAQMDLTPGDHTIVVETYDASGNAQISLSMESITPDFDVTYISRTPRYDRYNVSYEYSVDPSEPETGRPYLSAEELAKQRWPRPGETVTYTAHLRNSGSTDGSCNCKWYFDGVEVASVNTPTLAPGQEFTSSYSRPWDSETASHLIRFTADPDNAVPEAREDNNQREDATNGLSFRFHVWQSLYDWFAQNAKNYAGVASFEDWAQQNVAHMNDLLAQAVYPGTPHGIPERVRLDEVVVEPDAAPDPDPTGVHAPADWPWDGRRGFTNDYLADQGNGLNYFENNPSYLSDSDPETIRALSYELGLIDYSGMSIDKTANTVVSGIGHPDSYEFAALTTGGPFFSEHEAYALAANAHKRRGFSGEFLYDLPKIIRLRIIDAFRRPLSGANVRIYQEYPGRIVGPTLRFDLTADSQGLVTLPNRSCLGEMTTATGHRLRDNPFGLINTKGENGVFFAAVTSGSKTDYQFIEIARLNLAAWLGYGDDYTYELQTTILPEGRLATGELYCVKMHSPTLGYTVGAGGTILKYDGASWTSITSPTTNTLYTVDVSPSGNTLIVCGFSGAVYINDGSGWVSRKPQGVYAIYCCAALSDSVMFVGNTNGDLYRTSNAGVNWVKVTAGQGDQGALRSIRFRDAGNGMLLAAKPPVYVTADGGLTWTPTNGIDSTIGMLMDCALPSPESAWLAGVSGSVYWSGDGAGSWSSYADFTASEPWYGIDIWSNGSGWAVGRYHAVYNTTVIKRFQDGRWYSDSVCTSLTDSSLNDVALLSADDGWAVGKQGLILRLSSGSMMRSEECGSVGFLKSLPDGTSVTLTGAGTYISAVFPDCVYLETGDRSSGIKVYTTSGGTLGASAGATGILASENGERVIRSATLSYGSGSFQIEPLGMAGKTVGGGPNWEGTQTLALLVRTAGLVTNVGPNWITIDDGSGLTASDGSPGVKVLCDTLAPTPTAGQFTAVTGVATTEKVAGQVYRVVRPRGVGDVAAF